jgi:hypothetical protein
MLCKRSRGMRILEFPKTLLFPPCKIISFYSPFAKGAREILEKDGKGRIIIMLIVN